MACHVPIGQLVEHPEALRHDRHGATLTGIKVDGLDLGERRHDPPPYGRLLHSRTCANVTNERNEPSLSRLPVFFPTRPKDPPKVLSCHRHGGGAVPYVARARDSLTQWSQRKSRSMRGYGPIIPTPLYTPITESQFVSALLVQRPQFSK